MGADFSSSRRAFGFGSNAWSHDFPRAEHNLMLLLDDLTVIDVNRSVSLILSIDEPQLFRHPIVHMWGPGYWTIGDSDGDRQSQR
jgi:hypothetical protein